MAKTYKELLTNVTKKPVTIRHIEPRPRWGLAGAYVFTKMGTDELRSYVEQSIGAEPEVPEDYAIHCVTYVLPVTYDVKPSGTAQLKAKELGLPVTSAVFVRGAANAMTHKRAYETASGLINRTLLGLWQEDNSSVYVDFMDPDIRSQELAQSRILNAADKELKRMEGAVDNPFDFKFNALTGGPFGL